MITIKPVSDLRNDLPEYAECTCDVETALDEADRMAEEDRTRLSHEEVFDNLRRQV